MEGASVKIVKRSNIWRVFETSEGLADLAISMVILGIGMVSAEKSRAGINIIEIAVIININFFKVTSSVKNKEPVCLTGRKSSQSLKILNFNLWLVCSYFIVN